MKKIFFLFILLIAISLSSSGYVSSATEKSEQFIEVQTLSYNTGEIAQGFYFSTNEDFLLSLGANNEEVNLFLSRLRSNISKFRNLLIANFASIYLQNPIEEFAIGEKGGLIIQDVISKENNCIGFQLLFTSSGAWNYYHPNKSNNENNKNESEDLNFISKILSEGEIIFAQTLDYQQMTVGEYFIKMYIDAGEGIIDNLNENYSPQLIYDFAVGSSKLHSNADSVVYGNDNLYHHLWQRTIDNYKAASQLNLYYYKINQQWWYLTVILTGVAIVVVGCAFVLIIKKIKIKNK